MIVLQKIFITDGSKQCCSFSECVKADCQKNIQETKLKKSLEIMFSKMLAHHCLCIVFLKPYSTTGTRLVTFHCNNVEKSPLKIASKINKLYLRYHDL